MKKAELIKHIIGSLTESLEVLEKAARASHEEATQRPRAFDAIDGTPVADIKPVLPELNDS